MSPTKFIEVYGTFVAGIALFVFLLIFADNFASQANLLNVPKQGASSRSCGSASPSR